MKSVFGYLRLLVMAAVACAALNTLAQEQGGVSADQILKQGAAIVRLLDEGGIDAVWEVSSPVLRERVSKVDFAKVASGGRTSDARTVNSRNWVALTRANYDAGNAEKLPAGQYINLTYVSGDGTGRFLYELLSFRLESDGSWRLTGYVPRLS